MKKHNKMNRIKEVLFTASLLFFAIAGISYSIYASNHKKDLTFSPSHHGDDVESIRVALLLDTSGSMSGLIEQAKSQLWNILNELNDYEIHGETPRILISLYEYGSQKHGSYSGYIRQLLPFTTDMDLVSDKLFQLRTGGSKEYCGQVLYKSLNDLRWGKNTDDLKLVYIAGNESINQGPQSFSAACRSARKMDVTVNTIFCGDQYDGIQMGWKQGAELGKGEYMFINHNHETVYYESPYDDEIQSLNMRLNSTYIPMGAKGKVAYENQTRQDQNAGSYSRANYANRTSYKISKNYKNESWDLVDAYEADSAVVKEKASLPEEYQTLSDEEIEEKIQAKRAERESIKDQIRELKKKREDHVAKQKVEAEATPTDLQSSIIKSVENVAKDSKYKKKQ